MPDEENQKTVKVTAEGGKISENLLHLSYLQVFFLRQPQISEYFSSSGWRVSLLFLDGLSYMTFKGLPVWMRDLFSVAWALENLWKR